MATSILWPLDSLPIPIESDYSVKDSDSRIHSTMEAGHIFRREFATRGAECNCSIRVTKAQARAFESFFENDLDLGANWFRMPLYNHGTVRWHWVQFAEMPEYKVKGGIWTIISFCLTVSYYQTTMYYRTSSYYNKLHHVLHDVAPECTKIPSGVSL